MKVKSNTSQSITDKLLTSLLTIPKGKVTTYKALAVKFNIHPRQVGRILHNNQVPETLPCYKVVKSDGSIASGYNNGGPEEQYKRLKQDNVPFSKTSSKTKVDLIKALCIL